MTPEEFTFDVSAVPLSKEDLKIVVGFTFNPAAWEMLKEKYDTVNFEKDTYIEGIPCYVLSTQTEECLGWYTKEVMQMWINADKLESESKGSA
jgi:hypothetical protein